MDNVSPCIDLSVYMFHGVFPVIRRTLNMEGESTPSLQCHPAKMLLSRTRPPSITSLLDWIIQHLPPMSLSLYSTWIQAWCKVALICTRKDPLKITHHSDLTFVQTADALSAAVLHDQVAKNHRYQGWVRVCFRAVSLNFPDFRTIPFVIPTYIMISF